MRKLILKNLMSPGDIVLLTAAVRDLHRCYPGQFATDVRTHCPDLWENNPHLTPLEENEPGVEIVDCDLPLIDLCNEQPYHVIHGFIDFLNAHLDLRIRPTAFSGDIHLSAQERAWHSQIRELTGNDIPYWIVAAGGKYDVTIKWWATERYQQVVDHFLGKIQFVQVGDWGHYHPPLKGVIDLRGQTNLRELVRLVYHAEGVLCSITALMHLAAAVETKTAGRSRACVVIAGGREPAHWEAYPDHQFIHTTGALPCCTGGGCWRDRVLPLGDGDPRDQPDHLCVDVVGRLPRCLHVITPDDVIRRIQLYEQGGSLRYLARTEWAAAKRGIKATRHNDFDDQPLTLPTARIALEAFLPTLTPCPDGFAGRGIVICGGGPRYFTNAWVCIHRLRGLGCALPIEVWHLGDEEIDAEMRSLLEPLGVRCVDGLKVRASHPVRRLAGYELKPFALLYSSFAEVLFLDADNVPVADPEGLFATPEYQKCGAIFWPDFEQLPEGEVIWKSCNLARPSGPEFESGQMVIDKRRCWEPLRLAMWFNEHSDFFYKHLLGDKETFHLAFCKLDRPFHLVATPIHALEATMCQHDLQGRRLFQHRNMDKWNLFLRNKLVDDFWFEEECIGHVKNLREKWDGRASRYRPALPPARRVRPSLAITVCLISCAQRRALREQTLNHLAATDWGDEPVLLQMDPGGDQPPDQRQVANSRLALQAGLARPGDYLLFLEDDLEFNLHLRHNLEHWLPLQAGAVTLAGLYNPDVPEIACDFEHNYVVLAPERVFGSQAFLLSRAAAQYVVEHWDEGERLQDIRISRLAARLGNPIFYHAPSLVQHVGRTSSWGGFFHEAADFDKYWRASFGESPKSRVVRLTVQ